ncbi:hypothetical protein GCM10011430_09190 [Oxalicibacterium solurbis]|uniref:Uncharacterized protein n=1 Tax=Oxalicibacterium solurbis TaxID=69280 RepID=A0A8J3B2L7_9BURK|nr:hypothetical protein GCM10011430_09190 [Oxalicibacterium solurbis]
MTMLVVQRTGVWPFCTLMAQHPVLLWREKPAPFFIGMRDSEGFLSGSWCCMSRTWHKARRNQRTCHSGGEAATGKQE